MQRIDTEFSFKHSGTIFKAINVPALFCHSCGETLVPKPISERIQVYAEQCDSEIVDFKVHSAKEAADTMAVLYIMWGM